MKKLFILTALTLGLSSCGIQSIPQQKNEVDAAFAEITNQYKRRSDLIPNLVSTVKGYASHEKDTLTGVTEARAKATQLTVDASSLTPEKLENFRKVQGDLSMALGKLMSIAENYPQLKADTQFRDLQAQLEGTENRINVSRQRFNDAVNVYETSRRSFPAVIFSGMMGFKEKGYFKADAGAEKAPEVKF